MMQFASLQFSAGGEVQDEWERKLGEHGLVGQACISRPGRMNIRGIVHVIAPECRGATEDYSDLQPVVEHCFALASGANYQSIALPAIGRGQGFSARTVATCISNVIQEYVNGKETSLQRIEIVEKNKTCLAEIKDRLGQVLAERGNRRNASNTIPGGTTSYIIKHYQTYSHFKIPQRLKLCVYVWLV